MDETTDAMPTINSFYDEETQQEFAIEDTVARTRSELAQDTADEAKATAEEAIEAAEAAAGKGIESTPAWVSHRNTYRGKNLGNEYTAEQKEAVSSGTFDDLYVGDYWVINDVTWRIADINYWMGTGSKSQPTSIVVANHLVIVPDNPIATAAMNNTDTSTGGYLNSAMVTTTLPQVQTTVTSAFGASSLLTHSAIYSNAVSNGAASGVMWANRVVDLPSQNMLMGANIVYAYSGQPLFNSTVDKTQLALFNMRPQLIIATTEALWLRDVVNAQDFAILSYEGNISSSHASYSVGVRPVFGIVG